MRKPEYSTSKRFLWASFFAAWGVIYLIVIGALAGSEGATGMAALAIPSLLALVASLLGIHRHFGSRDFEAMASAAKEGTP